MLMQECFNLVCSRHPVFNDRIAQNGLYFISGSANTPLASKVTATYAF